MAEWLIEEGIGEERAIRLTYDGIEEARVRWPGEQLQAGEIAEARLVQRIGDGADGIVEFANGERAYGTLIPRQVSIGGTVRMEIWREAMAERGRLKLAQARYSEAELRPAPSLTDELRAKGFAVTLTRRFPDFADWEDLWSDAAHQQVDFNAGSLLFALTPAMTLIDVDCARPETVLSGGIAVLARSLRRFDLGGNIGVDFPTLQDKEDRRSVDRRLAECLRDWPHERTAMNGFGFVQIIARIARPSLLHRIAFHRTSAAARLLLRKAEGLEGAGKIELFAHPAVLARLDDQFLSELRRRMGREIISRPDPGLAIEAPHAQLVAP